MQISILILFLHKTKTSLMKTKLSFIILISLFFVFVSCDDDTNNTNNKPDIEVEDQIDQLVYPIPTPFETTQMLQEAGAAYIADLTNDVTKAENYFKEKSQALNLGVFGADLAYASTYNQAQSIRDILAASKNLSDQLGLTNIIDQGIIQRVEQNIDNGDTLYKIVNNTYYETFNKLNSENKGAVAVMVISGAWIESLYISTQLAITSTDMSVLSSRIAEQKFTANTLIPLLDQYKNENADIAELAGIVQNIKNVFDKIEADEDGNITMDEATLEELMTVAKTEREKIVTMQ